MSNYTNAPAQNCGIIDNKNGLLKYSDGTVIQDGTIIPLGLNMAVEVETGRMPYFHRPTRGTGNE